MVRAVLLVLMVLLPSAAHAQRRVAMLVGNQGYTGEIGRLANPHNDVALLEQSLTRIGFEVATVRDASLGDLHQALSTHVRRVRAAGLNAVGFFYYSGHGAQDGATGTNYIIPVGISSSEDGTLWDRSLRLNEITHKLKAEAANAVHFVVIDACRNALKLKSAGTRSLVQSKGFVPLREETGMLIAYATAEGELASDLGVGSGPYARVLAEEIVKPGVEAVTMFRRVQLRVRAAIGQEPWLGFGALGEVHLAGRPTVGSGLPPALSQEHQSELALWNAVKGSKERKVIQKYLDHYPQGVFSGLAHVLMTRLQREEAKNAAGLAKGKRCDGDQILKNGACVAKVGSKDGSDAAQPVASDGKTCFVFDGRRYCQ